MQLQPLIARRLCLSILKARGFKNGPTFRSCKVRDIITEGAVLSRNVVFSLISSIDLWHKDLFVTLDVNLHPFLKIILNFLSFFLILIDFDLH